MSATLSIPTGNSICMKRFLFIIPLCLLGKISLAQYNDANLWLGGSVNVPIIKPLKFEYSTQTRFYNNASTLQNYFNAFGLSYSTPVKRLDVGLTYRVSRKNAGEYWWTENRFNLDINYGYKIKPANLSLKARLRLQTSFDRLGVINDVFPSQKNVARFKLKMEYKIPDFKLIQPWMAYEGFYAFAPANPISPVDQYRLQVGATVDLPKRLELDLRYIFERENRTILQNNHIYVITLSYTLFKDPIFGKEEEVIEEENTDSK